MSLEEFKKFTQIRPAMDFIGATPDYGPQITVLMGSRPNEPIHRGHIGAIGHVMAVSPPPGPPVLASAHAILAGLDAAGGMAFAPKFGKPGLAHLNGQNGCRYGQDKRFGVENLRGAVNPIQALCGHNYGANGEMVGLDIKAMDAALHRRVTGVDNARILQNLPRLLRARPVVVRVPLVAKLNLGQVKAIAQYLSSLTGELRVELLKYHALGKGKYVRLGRQFVEYAPPTDAQMRVAAAEFERRGVEVAF